eukprot:173329_1
MSRCLCLLLVVISVTQVFGGCEVCGSQGTEDQKASFCVNACFPDKEECELEKGEPSCWWDSKKPKSSRCVKELGSDELCYFQDLESAATVGNQCVANSKCARGRGYCQQCKVCTKGIHKITGRTKALTSCYLAPTGTDGAIGCVFDYSDNVMMKRKVDYCMKPSSFKKVCKPFDDIDVKFIYVEASEGVTWREAQAICRDDYGADLGTIIEEAALQEALQEVGFGASPWIGMRSTDPDLDFSPVDCTECPVFHHGHSCRGCTEKDLWQNGLPIKEGGSHCVRLVQEDATITNDVDCDELLYAVLCNCEDTASSDCTETPPYPYNE